MPEKGASFKTIQVNILPNDKFESNHVTKETSDKIQLSANDLAQYIPTIEKAYLSIFTAEALVLFSLNIKFLSRK